MPLSRIQALLFLIGAATACLEAAAQAQSRLSIIEETAASGQQEGAADTSTTFETVSPPDSAKPRWQARLDAGYRTPAVHPYFRDEYRVIQDLRRLLSFVDPHALPELASVPEMLAIVQAMPPARQNRVIGAAIAGSIVNQISEMVSKHLRRTPAKFLQWQAERVTVRTAFQGLEARWYNGVNLSGMSLSFPLRGLAYSRQAGKNYVYEGVNYSPWPRFGFQYGRFNGAPLFGPRVASPFGHFNLNYDAGGKAAISVFEFRRQMKVIVRMVYANYFKIKRADFLRSEVMLRW